MSDIEELDDLAVQLIRRAIQVDGIDAHLGTVVGKRDDHPHGRLHHEHIRFGNSVMLWRRFFRFHRSFPAMLFDQRGSIFVDDAAAALPRLFLDDIVGAEQACLGAVSPEKSAHAGLDDDGFAIGAGRRRGRLRRQAAA